MVRKRPSYCADVRVSRGNIRNATRLITTEERNLACDETELMVGMVKTNAYLANGNSGRALV